MKIIFFTAFLLLPFCVLQAADNNPPTRNLVTDEPRVPKGKPEGVPEYSAKAAASDGQHLALTMQKLEHGMDRPLVVWALGSSYCNMLGNGEIWLQEIPKRFPNAPPIKYRKMVGNSCPWQYLTGWARHLVIPDQPDLVLIYTIGNPADLEKLIVELRTHTTADIIVPSIHWRERDADLWGTSENAADQDVAMVRELCRKYDVEFVESRKAWAEYLETNGLPINSLLKDAVHQSEYGARIINLNILAHLRTPNKFSYESSDRERDVQPTRDRDGAYQVPFTGTRIDLHGTKAPNGGTFAVRIDGKPADQIEAFLMSYVNPGEDNSKKRVGTSPTVPRDAAPHGVQLGTQVVPQTWTIVMTSDDRDFELRGSQIGRDGTGNAFKPFTSTSGQIIIQPELWRRAERNHIGDRFTFDVSRSVVAEVSFKGTEGERFSVRLAQALKNDSHTLELVPIAAGEASLEAFKVYQPPLVTP